MGSRHIRFIIRQLTIGYDVIVDGDGDILRGFVRWCCSCGRVAPASLQPCRASQPGAAACSPSVLQSNSTSLTRMSSKIYATSLGANMLTYQVKWEYPNTVANGKHVNSHDVTHGTDRCLCVDVCVHPKQHLRRAHVTSFCRQVQRCLAFLSRHTTRVYKTE